MNAIAVIMTVFSCLGALDRITGNRMGLGKEFEKGLSIFGIMALSMVGSVFTTFNYGPFFTTVGTLGLAVGDWIVLAVALICLWVYDWKRSAVVAGFKSLSPTWKTAVICALGLIVLVFGMYGIGFNAAEFIYSRF